MKTYLQFALRLIPVAILASATVAEAAPVKLSVTPGYRTVYNNQTTTIPVKVSLEGIALPQPLSRPKANIAIVIDRSGSMSGEKIEQARAAAIAAVSMLSSDDIVSVITYDDNAQVVVPATKLSAKQSVIESIRSISLGGSTALFAGVSLGAAEIAKFRDPSFVNRVVLISDGLANVGPSSPSELGDLGASLGKDGIAVSTIGLGLGYNEDLMAQLARRSDGNHVFAERATDLAAVFQNEFNDILSVVAQNVVLTINCRPGARPTRVLGRDADLYGDRISSRLNQVYGGQEKYLLFELQTDPKVLGEGREIVSVELSYWDPVEKRQITVSDRSSVALAASRAEVDNSIDRPTFTAYYTQLSALASEQAIALADQGKKADAIRLLENTALDNEKAAAELAIPELTVESDKRKAQGRSLAQEPYSKARKQLKFENQADFSNQAPSKR